MCRIGGSMAFPSDLATVRCPVSSGRVAASWWSARADGTQVHSMGIGDPLSAGRMHMTSCAFRCDHPGGTARRVGLSQGGGRRWARVSASVVIVTSVVSVTVPWPRGLLGSYLTCRCMRCVW